jgi:hypothetical protein
VNENFIDDLIDLNNHNNYGGSRAHERFSVDYFLSKVQNAGGTVVLDCADYGGDHIVLFSEEKHYPDTIDQNRYCVAQVTSNGFLASFERGTFQECFDCLVEWSRTEVMDVA